ncbi:MAG: hypothetical protein ABJB98_10995 [Actinomycetota bacterium]
MRSYRTEVLQSWVHTAPSVRDLTDLLHIGAPTTVLTILDRLGLVESFTVETDINTNDGTPINGHVGFELSSDGSYRFFGHIRATGFPSYNYGLQAWVTTSGGPVIAAQRTGNVYGTDTPGRRQDNFSESGNNPAIALNWATLRDSHGLGFSMHAEIGGVLGTAIDVLEFAVKGILANAVLGPAGWIVLVGTELADIGVRIGTPDVIAGLVTAGAVLWVLGPFGLIPAVVAGVVVAEAIDVKHRAMTVGERSFADRVFNGTVDFDRVTLTNLSHDNGRKYTIPSVDDSILVNLDDAFEKPMSYAQAGTDYSQPGSVFIHELTHAWQITTNSFLGVLCGMDSNYSYHTGLSEAARLTDLSWSGLAWNSFNNEQQAHIVDDWYGAHVSTGAAGMYLLNNGIPVTDLNGAAALRDPAYHFIRDNIRTGTI